MKIYISYIGQRWRVNSVEPAIGACFKEYEVPRDRFTAALLTAREIASDYNARRHRLPRDVESDLPDKLV
ncbi:MAG: hypothetical protein HYW25_05100 [Candidatus Aenigmarchaeota archaeon]|nr:hypothetical protein [Candidatus Aenigmarchaeota archaeon]